MRFSLARRKRISSIPAVIFILLILSGATVGLIEVHLKPTLLAIAEAKATMIATQVINGVINDRTSLNIDPQNLVQVHLDNKGRVALIQPNTIEFNRLAADTTIKVQDALQKITEEKISIPIGQVLGSQLLASMGPKITVIVIPMGTVQVQVVDKFEQAGINQTRHMVYLMTTTQVRIVVPLVSKSVSVNTQVPIAEYVVVGDVPGTYVQIPLPMLSEAGLLGSSSSGNSAGEGSNGK
ncbi:MAG: sporulation protein YunB [Sporomusaceae bacterium]|nr:sporulation protein YunB [Sporomusaceae bacterium]